MLYHSLLFTECKGLKIDWDEQHRVFRVQFKATLVHSKGVTDDFIRTFPVEIAERSTCRCGAFLKLGNFTMDVAETTLEFRAVYYCDSCNREIEARSRGLRNAILRWIKFIKRVKIGLDGVEIEKNYTKK